MQNWLIGQHIQKQQEEAARQAQQRAMNAKIARMEEAEGAALAAKPQRAEQAYQAYRAGERASYEPAAPTPTATPTPLKTPQPALPPTPPTPPLRAAPATSTPPKPVAAVPTIIPTLTPTPTPLPPPQAAGKPWWLSPALEDAAKTLVQTIPSAKIDSWRNPSPAFSWVAPGHVISFGRVSSGMLASDANPNLTLNPDGSLTPSVGRQPIASLTPRPDGFDFNLRNPWQRYEFAEGAIKATLSSSVTARVTWGGFWNTTVGVDVNYPEVQVNGVGMKGRVSDGWYVEYKPGQILTYVVGVQIIVAGFLLLPEISTAVGSFAQPVYEAIKQLLTNSNPVLR